MALPTEPHQFEPLDRLLREGRLRFNNPPPFVDYWQRSGWVSGGRRGGGKQRSMFVHENLPDIHLELVDGVWQRRAPFIGVDWGDQSFSSWFVVDDPHR